MTVITRFPPSPTGFVHIGSLRTALYNYLFTKQQKGKLIIRIEDTDQTRQVDGAVENLLKTLKWAGIEYDEGPVLKEKHIVTNDHIFTNDKGQITKPLSTDVKNNKQSDMYGHLEEKGSHGPYIQSKRLDLYKKYAQELIEKGHAYYCFCTKERLEEMRKKQESLKLAPQYDRFCLKLDKKEIENNLKKGISCVIRQKIPNGNIEFNDIIRGHVTFATQTLDDQILIKSDGFPTYHLANVVDDHLMEVTHVIRGEEWLPSTPKHIHLYQALGWNLPIFAHLPLLLNPDKSKLSKRQGDVAVEEFIEKGYLRDALINFIALLGWHPTENEEIYTLNDLIEKFSLKRVQKAGAVFNKEKLDWMNSVYIKKLSIEELAQLIVPYLQKESWYRENPNILKYIQLIRERLKILSEAPGMLKFFFLDHLKYDVTLFENAKMKVDKNMAKNSLQFANDTLKNHEFWEKDEDLKVPLLSIVEKLQIKNGQLLWPLRVALTNEAFSPGVFELLAAYGKEKSLQRISEALMTLKS
ncbi:glutamate--tRNA ligase [Candidatus Peregrinibacteria bacterium]|nr:glutamate--tRNA ligase [Candidatus Peregrinibacteria bacterium]